MKKRERARDFTSNPSNTEMKLALQGEEDSLIQQGVPLGKERERLLNINNNIKKKISAIFPIIKNFRFCNRNIWINIRIKIKRLYN